MGVADSYLRIHPFTVKFWQNCSCCPFKLCVQPKMSYNFLSHIGLLIFKSVCTFSFC